MLSDHWGIATRPARVEIGVNKHTWRVGQRWLSCTADYRVQEVQRELLLYAHLRERAHLPGAVAVPFPQASSQGLLVCANERVWWVSEHVAGRRPAVGNPADTLAVACGLAGLHAWLQPVPAELAVSADDSLTLYARAWELLADPQRLGLTPADMVTLREACGLVDAYLATAVPPLPRQLIHGDPSHPNLRLSAGAGRQLVGALDWESCRVDFPLSDLATLGQTVVFRAGGANSLAGLGAIHAAYGQLARSRCEISDLLMFMILGKFESIAHHGARFLRGEARQELVRSQPEKIRLLLDLLMRVRTECGPRGPERREL